MVAHSTSKNTATNKSGSLKIWFLQQLHQKGVRMTAQRLTVTTEIAACSGHFDMEQLLSRMHAKGLKISRATAYRTLETLQACNLVEKRDFGKSGRVYENVIPGGHHDHLICTKCGRVTEFDSPELEKIQQYICDKLGFAQVSHTHHVFGICQQCQHL